MTLSEKIAYCRKKAVLSQEALAEKLGVSRQAVSKWETGESVPELNKMAALAKTLNTSVDWLLSPDDPAPEEAPSKDGATYPEWVDKMPAFLRKLFYRWGWLMGVYIAFLGAIFAAFGCLMKFLTDSFVTNVQKSWESFGVELGGFGMSDGFGSIEPFGGVDSIFNPMSMIDNFVIGIGVVLLIVGFVLAILLKRYGKDKA